jgi:sugar phosphate isomerase/epimerase
MPRPVTLFTGQFADIPFSRMAEKAASWGYDGLEIACWGEHLDVDKASKDKKYTDGILEVLKKNKLECFAISNHLAGQLVCDPNSDARSDGFAPADCRGDAGAKRKWAADAMKKTAAAAESLGVKVVNGFTGSSIWHMLYSFPPVPDEMIEEGFKFFAGQWNPILDVFKQHGVRFALEVHPTEIAFDIITARRALSAIGNRKEFGFNFDPSHLIWQGIDPERFIKSFPGRIYHAHIKDAAVTLDGESGILGSHLNFGSPGRGWDFRSPGRGDVNFEEIIRALNQAGYEGPLSVEWEDSGMDREFGAREACSFVKGLDFPKSEAAFDDAFIDRE